MCPLEDLADPLSIVVFCNHTGERLSEILFLWLKCLSLLCIRILYPVLLGAYFFPRLRAEYTLDWRGAPWPHALSFAAWLS